MYTEIIYLVHKEFTQDLVGNMTAVETLRKSFAKLNNVSVKEFYSGVSAGITPDMEFQIHALNYDGEDELEYAGKRYHVIRMIRKQIGVNADVVLVVAEKTGDR